MNERTLELTLKVKDDGSVVIDTVTKKTEDLGKTTESASGRSSKALAGLKENWLALAAGVTAGYLAISKTIGTLNSFVKEAAEAEKIESRMAFQIEAAGYQYNKVQKAIDAYAESIQQTTRFSDEAAREGLGKMMQYTNDLEAATKNLRLAMDATIQTGIPLETTIKWIGFAMEGEIEILARMNPAFKDLNVTLGANATKAEKSAYAMEFFIKKFSGASLKDLNTYSGALEKMKNQMDDIKETIGRKLMPYWEDWVAGVQSYIGSAKKADEESKKLKEGLGDIAEESKKVQSMKYYLGMKGLSEEAGEFRKEMKFMAESTEAFDDAMKSLGITSQRAMETQVEWVLRSVKTVEENFKRGKASALDYANAIKAANEALKKGLGVEKDVTKEKVDLYIESQKRIAEISPDDPQRKQKIQAEIDDWMEKRKKLEEMSKPPIPVNVDIAQGLAETERLKEKIKTTKQQIDEATKAPIPVNVDIAQGLAEMSRLRERYEAMKQQIESNPIRLNIPATIESSPRVPFSEGIKNMIEKFGSLENAIKNIESNISIAGFGLEISKIEKQLAKLADIQPSWMRMMSTGGSSNPMARAWGLDAAQMAPINAQMAELGEQIRILQMKQDLEKLKILGGYASGTSFVPRTGPYMLHEGEKVIPKNVSMGDIHISVGGGDPKKTVDLLIKTLKYRLSGELKGLL